MSLPRNQETETLVARVAPGVIGLASYHVAHHANPTIAVVLLCVGFAATVLGALAS